MDQEVIADCRAKRMTAFALLNPAMVHDEFDAVSQIDLDIQHFDPPHSSVELATSHIITCLLDTMPFTPETAGI